MKQKLLISLICILMVVFAGCKNSDTFQGELNNVKKTEQAVVETDLGYVEGWKRELEYGTHAGAYALTQDSNGAVIPGGWYYDATLLRYRWRSTKISSAGNIQATSDFLWITEQGYITSMTYDQMGNTYGIGIVQIPGPQCNNKGFFFLHVVKLDTNFNAVYEYTSPHASCFYRKEGVVGPDGNLYITSEKSITGGNQVVTVEKLDPTGNLIGNGFNILPKEGFTRRESYGILVLQNGNIITCGSHIESYGGQPHYREVGNVVMTDPTGNILFDTDLEFTTGGRNKIRGCSLVNDGIVLAGETNYPSSTSRVAKIDYTGNVLWINEDKLAPTAYFEALWDSASDADGYTYAAGYAVYSTNPDDAKVIVGKYSPEGVKVWSGEFFDTIIPDEEEGDIQQYGHALIVKDGRIYVSGATVDVVDNAAEKRKMLVFELKPVEPVVDDSAIIDPSITIGDGSSIGANTTVKSNIPEGVDIDTDGTVAKNVIVKPSTDAGTNLDAKPQSVVSGTLGKDFTLKKGSKILLLCPDNTTEAPSILGDGGTLQANHVIECGCVVGKDYRGGAGGKLGHHSQVGDKVIFEPQVEVPPYSCIPSGITVTQATANSFPCS